MTLPVDLGSLRHMTGGDPEMEKALFAEFTASFERSFRELAESADSESWRHGVHALKGISFSLGAGALGELCQEAQEKYPPDPAARRLLLASIDAEYRRVREFLGSL